jgi:hypothetical protein
MTSITPEILRKISATCSGHAMKIFIPNATVDQIAEALNGINWRIVNGQDPEALRDRCATIVTGCENMSHTEFVCFVGQMDELRFRNILIFPTLTWRHPEDEFTIPFWDKMGTIMNQKFMSRVQQIMLEVK